MITEDVTKNNLFPIEIVATISTYLNVHDCVSLTSTCSYYEENKYDIFKIQTIVMLNYLNISLDELSIIGINKNDSYMKLFKQVRNFLYEKPPKIQTVVSRQINNKTKFYDVEAYIINSSLYNKFIPGIFPDDLPLYVRTYDIKHLIDLITCFKNHVPLSVTFFGILKLLPYELKYIMSPGKKFQLYDIKEKKIAELTYLEHMKYINICEPTHNNINDVHVFTTCVMDDVNIFYSSINENQERKNNVLQKVSNTYSSTYVISKDY